MGMFSAETQYWCGLRAVFNWASNSEIIPTDNYLNSLFHKSHIMKSVLLPEPLHAEIKAEAERLGRSLGYVIGQHRLERTRLAEMATNLKQLPRGGIFTLLTEDDQAVVLQCVRRYKP